MRWQKQIKSTLLYNNMCRRDGRHQSNWGVHLFALRDWVHHQRNIHWILPHGGNRRKCSLWPGPSYALTQQRSSDYVLMGRPTWVVFTVASPHSWLNAVHLKHCTSNAMPICKTWQSRIQCRVSCPVNEILWAPSRRFTISWRPAQSAMLSSIASNTREHL